ncbi:biotin/lipoyl-binding protein [Botrimarina hoheduenensis]|uniref:Putative peptide zinc metalloprotease protein YydH n=1 Tax=Botrimarina hoheduenensis TaxID=2528000 RepID=A0A5C5W728_9BACT|nr:biotin/lipoyl-binding protein [Botrimarina hoheduenensis]TWT46414.1 putative peptide zinc metalloprotease protein YydH [Botrimarina hoheduenensis]
MATLADSLVSSESRRMPIRVRPDLSARKHRYQGRQYWVVKDPVALQYFRFEEEEFAILRMLDGESSLEEIADRFEAEFPPQTIRTEELQQFIGTLHRSGLVIADAAGQGEQLKKLRDERERKELLGKLSNVLSIRFKGIDPDWLLNYLYALPPVRWFFSTPVFVLCCCLTLAAATLVAVEFDVFRAKLPSFDAFFTDRGWENWLLLGAVLGVTKVLHEFGHGLSCKHFGGECHEMGVMLLVLTPCLYCNVSDSWMLPNKWHRAAIGAAGMYVEVVLASICTFIWWFTEPGLLNYLCLNIMFVSSVSTILFNANPLLKYDGYYILSDLMEVPNLRQKATQILTRKLSEWCLGLEQPEDPFLPQRNKGMFALYTVAAAVYRWVVVFSILYFLNQVLEPYGLKIFGQALALMALWGLLGQPLWKVYKFLSVPGRLSKVKRTPVVVTGLLLAALIAAAVLVPLPAYVFCPFEIHPDPSATANVYAESPGVLRDVLVRPGDRVEEGQLLARLENPETLLTLTRIEGQIAADQAELRAFETISYGDSRATSRMAQLQESLASSRRQLVKQREDAARLELRAPRAGVVMAPDYVTPRETDAKQLTGWHGTPLDEQNVGATLEAGDHFCRVGDPMALEARLAIDQEEIELVRTGQRVRLLLNQSTDREYVSRLKQIADDEMPATPPRLSSLQGGAILTQMDATGRPKPIMPHFQAVAPLAAYEQLPEPARAAHERLRVGLLGEAKIEIEPMTVGRRLYRYLARTVNFDL